MYRFLGAFLVIFIGAVLAMPTGLQAAVPSGYIEETVTTVVRPVAMAFLPDGRLLIGSQGTAADGQAKIYVYKDGAVLPTAYTIVNDVYLSGAETGLLGIAVDPNFASNGFVYVFITVSPTNQVVRRFTTVGDVGTNPVNLITGIPTAGTNHNGGGLLIHENRLYVSVGENGNEDAAQLTNNWLGKILRFNLNGTVPPDNPFGAGNAVWAYGLRNSFRMAVQPGTNQIFASENGPAGFDELNRIVRGGNYGWPRHMGYTNVDGFRSPVWSSGLETGIVPTDLLFYAGDAMPEFSGQVFIAGWSDDAIYRATIDAAGNALVGGLVPFVTSVDQPVDLEVGPDGALWYCTRAGVIRRVFRVAGSNIAPTATFTLTPSSGPPPLLVTVNATASRDSDGTIANYLWTWGDGTSPRSGPTRRASGHVFNTSGIFTITLTVTDDDGASASSTRQVVVSADGNRPPSAHIEEVSAYSGPAPLTVDFVGHGHDADGDLLRYVWDFGDGSPVAAYTGVHPDTDVFLPHTFTTPGNFIVRLTVTDDGGLSSTNTVEITVTPAGPTGGSNLLINPGLEQGGSGWTSAGTASIVAGPVHSGSRAVSIAGSASAQVSLEQTVAVSGGTAYDVTSWVRTEAIGGGAVMMVLWQDASGRNLAVDRTPSIRGTHEWMQLAATFVAPAQAASARLSIRVGREADGAGTVSFDDVGMALTD